MNDIQFLMMKLRKAEKERDEAQAKLAQVRALSDAWRHEGVAPDFWIELNRAILAQPDDH